MDRKAGVAYLSSSDGTLLEISESKLSEDDLNYIRSVGHKVTSYLFHFPFRSLSNSEQTPQQGTSPTVPGVTLSHPLTGSVDPSNPKRPSIWRRVFSKLLGNR